MKSRGLYKKMKSWKAFPFIFGFVLVVLSNLIVDYWYTSPGRPISQSLKLEIPVDLPLVVNEDKIWFITATKHSFSQAPRLVRLAQALYKVRDFITWVVVQELNIEDESTEEYLPELEKLLSRFGISFLLLSTKRSISSLSEINDAPSVFARLTALDWILQNASGGVLFFASEDFIYDHRIFAEIRHTKKISTWPVGLGRKYGLTSPVLSPNGELIGYFDGSDPLEIVRNDMPLNLGGHAFNLNYLKKTVSASDRWKLGLRNHDSLVSLGLLMSDVQPLAEQCTKIYVWRGKTRDHPWPKEKWRKNLKGTNIEVLLKNTFWNELDSFVDSKLTHV